MGHAAASAGGGAARALRPVAALVERCADAAAAVAAVALLALFGLAAVEILMRAAFGTSLPVALELSTYLLCVTMTGGAARTLRNGGHVRILLLLGRLPPGPRRVAEIGLHAVAAAVAALASASVAVMAAESLANDARSFMAAGTPVGWPQAALALNLGLLAAQFACTGASLASGAPAGAPARAGASDPAPSPAPTPE